MIYTCQQYEILTNMSAEGVVFWAIDQEDGVVACANLNDTFVLAADAHVIYPGDVDILNAVYSLHGVDGITAWATVKRKSLPLEKYRTEDFMKALLDLACKYEQESL